MIRQLLNVDKWSYSEALFTVNLKKKKEEKDSNYRIDKSMIDA